MDVDVGAVDGLVVLGEAGLMLGRAEVSFGLRLLWFPDVIIQLTFLNKKKGGSGEVKVNP